MYRVRVILQIAAFLVVFAAMIAFQAQSDIVEAGRVARDGEPSGTMAIRQDPWTAPFTGDDRLYYGP